MKFIQTMLEQKPRYVTTEFVIVKTITCQWTWFKNRPYLSTFLADAKSGSYSCSIAQKEEQFLPI